MEEIRLAVGEACALLVGPDASRAAAYDPVVVTMRLGERLQVEVRGAGHVEDTDPPSSDIDGVEPWALLRGLIDDFEVGTDDVGTTLSMSWPLEGPAA